LNIDSFIKAIDTKNSKEIENIIQQNVGLLNKNDIDVVLELYNKGSLTPERLQYIMENCTHFLKLSSPFIKRLMKEDNTSLLDIIFTKFKFFDQEFIIQLLLYYKNHEPLSSSEFHQHLEKYTFSLDRNTFSFGRVEPRQCKYLFNACDMGNIALVRYLLAHGANPHIEDNRGETALFYACHSGHEAIAKYLVTHGVDTDIQKENNRGETP